MKVLLIKADQAGSGALRVVEPGRVASAHGVDITITSEFDVEGVRLPDGRIRIDELKHDADVLVLQRPLPQSHHAVAVAAKRQGIALVADLDDDFHQVNPNNVASSAVDPALSPMHNKRWLLETVKLCDVVTVSTPALLKYAIGQTKGIVVRNRLPERALRTNRGESTGRVGWTGTVQTHPADLSRARGVMDQVVTPFTVIGDREGIARALGVEEAQVELASGWVDSLDDYWALIAEHLDVGIAPLEVSKFNKAKSSLKCLDYMYAGKPFVASPLPEYQLIAKLSGAGEIAHSGSQWASKTRKMLDSPEPYWEAGQIWAKNNTLESAIERWISAWEYAHKNRWGANDI